MIRAVFFDASGVLYDREQPTEVFAKALLARAGCLREPSAREKDRQKELGQAATIVK